MSNASWPSLLRGFWWQDAVRWIDRKSNDVRSNVGAQEGPGVDYVGEIRAFERLDSARLLGRLHRISHRLF